jgi:hypothetical protein
VEVPKKWSCGRCPSCEIEDTLKVVNILGRYSASDVSREHFHEAGNFPSFYLSRKGIPVEKRAWWWRRFMWWGMY